MRSTLSGCRLASREPPLAPGQHTERRCCVAVLGACCFAAQSLSCLPVCSCGEMGGRNPTVPSRASTMSSHFVFVSTNLNKLRDIHDSRARAGMGRTDDGRRRRMVGERMMDDEMVEDEMMLP